MALLNPSLCMFLSLIQFRLNHLIAQYSYHRGLDTSDLEKTRKLQLFILWAHIVAKILVGKGKKDHSVWDEKRW